MRVNDAVLGLVLILGAAAVALQAHGFPDLPGQSFGSSLMPTLIAAGLGGCGVALVVGGLRRRDEPWLALGPWARSPGRILDAALVLGGLVAVILLWHRLGFVILATGLTGLLITRFRGGHAVGSFAIAVAAVLVIDWAFRHLLLVPLPQGPLTGLYW
jgi:putative tricarboxylic transport membrane protein